MISGRPVPPYVALIPVLVGVFIAADDQTVVVTILPQIMLDMKVEVTELNRASWTITGYLLGYVGVMPLIGRLSDTWGHRRLFLASLVGFMVGSVAVALVPNLSWLIAARVFQAIGAGALIPISIAMAGDLFPAGSRGVPLGLIGASAEAGGVIGPLWGGIITRYLDWQWVFWINIPLALVVIMLVFLLLRPSPRYSTRVDYAGAGLIAVGLVTLTLGLSRIASLDLLTLVYFGASSGSIALFVMRQRTTTDPLLHPSMFRSWAFSAANVTHVFVGAALIIAMVTIPLMANTSLGLTPLEGGLRLMRLTAAMPVGAILGGLACQRFDYRMPSVAGLALVSLGFVFMSSWDIDVSDPILTIHLATAGLGFGLLIAPIALAATDSVGQENRGTAAAMVTAMRIVGMTLGLAALTAWGTDRFGNLVAHMNLPFPLPGETAAQAQQRVAEFDAQLRDASMTLFSDFFLIAMGLSIAAIVPVAFMAWSRHRSTSEDP